MEGENLKLALKEVGKLIKKNLKQAAKDDGFKASGKLDRSFKYRVEDNELYIFGEQYANALSDGISTGGGSDEEGFKNLQSNIIKWAKIKGIRPQIRDKKGRFTKVSDRAWKSLGYVLARSIRQKGISERFGYKGSGFIQAVQEQTREQIKTILKEGYRKDILLSLNKLKSIN